MNVLIIHEVHPTLTKILQDKGFVVNTKLGLNRKEIMELLPAYNGLIVRSALKVDSEIIDSAAQLKFIGRLGAGMENIDLEYALSKGIAVFNAPEGNRSAVGEQAVGMLLMLLNNLLRADAEVRKGIWQREKNRGEEIEAKTIGIIGYGNMGGAFARKISGFGARVIAYDKYKSGFSDEYVKEVTLDHIFQESDIISLHTPLQKDTYYMVNREFINSFEKEIIIINTSRGQVIKTIDLVQALQSGKVKGACLDVLEFEGMSFEELPATDTSDFQFLTRASNVVLSPHIAGWTHQSNLKMAEVLANKIIRYFG